MILLFSIFSRHILTHLCTCGEFTWPHKSQSSACSMGTSLIHVGSGWFDPCRFWLVVHKLIYQLTCVQPAFWVFPKQLVLPALARSSNHCVQPATHNSVVWEVPPSARTVLMGQSSNCIIYGLRYTFNQSQTSILPYQTVSILTATIQQIIGCVVYNLLLHLNRSAHIQVTFYQ